MRIPATIAMRGYRGVWMVMVIALCSVRRSWEAVLRMVSSIPPRVPKVQGPGGGPLHLGACGCSTASPTSVVERGSAGTPPVVSEGEVPSRLPGSQPTLSRAGGTLAPRGVTALHGLQGGVPHRAGGAGRAEA